MVQQRNIVNTKLNEKHLQMLEDKFLALEREADLKDQAEKNKRKVNFLKKNIIRQVNYKQVAEERLKL